MVLFSSTVLQIFWVLSALASALTYLLKSVISSDYIIESPGVLAYIIGLFPQRLHPVQIRPLKFH